MNKTTKETEKKKKTKQLNFQPCDSNEKKKVYISNINWLMIFYTNKLCDSCFG